MAIKKFFEKFKIHFGKVSAILVAVFAVLLATDLILKHCEEAFDWNFTVIPRLIWVESGYRNTGAAFSFLADTEWGRIFLIVLTCIMVLAMCVCFLLLPERFVLLKLALAMIVSGAVGNLVDRIAFGSVRDFVWVNMLFSEACCNFADFWIVFGVIIAVVDCLFFNEWSLIPLTAKAKAAQAEREREEKRRAAEKEDGRMAESGSRGNRNAEESGSPDGSVKAQPDECKDGEAGQGLNTARKDGKEACPPDGEGAGKEGE